jgi:hypothetical protein
MTAIGATAASIRATLGEQGTRAITALGNAGIPERVGNAIGNMAHRSLHEAVSGWLARVPVVGGHAVTNYVATGTLGFTTSRLGAALTTASDRIADPTLQRVANFASRTVKGGGDGILSGEVHDAVAELRRKFPEA